MPRSLAPHDISIQYHHLSLEDEDGMMRGIWYFFLFQRWWTIKHTNCSHLIESNSEQSAYHQKERCGKSEKREWTGPTKPATSFHRHRQAIINSSNDWTDFSSISSHQYEQDELFAGFTEPANCCLFVCSRSSKIKNLRVKVYRMVYLDARSTFICERNFFLKNENNKKKNIERMRNVKRKARI